MEEYRRVGKKVQTKREMRGERGGGGRSLL